MSQTVLEVRNLSKLYRLGEVGTGTLSHDLNRWWAKIRGKEDPYTIIGQSNRRELDSKSDFVWTLKDLNFDVKEGEILGIIGANGAGKSTLLKLISRITTPTTGRIRARGRIASLLEVGTGMHPDMTARENIYLNGAILGMRRQEITRQFDDIIEFAGCRMYVDTPVKRFSSGMRVRLGFAVAAFLQAEILIVDEVLAVGDAEFQKKCLGKMQDVGASGRTVLFVSHNHTALRTLCSRAVLLQSGRLVSDGPVDRLIDEYLAAIHQRQVSRWTAGEQFNRDMPARFLEASVSSPQAAQGGPYPLDCPLNFRLKFEVFQPGATVTPSIALSDFGGLVAFNTYPDPDKRKPLATGVYEAECTVPANLLNEGVYTLRCLLLCNGEAIEDYPHLLQFDTVSRAVRRDGWYERPIGVVHPHLPWSINPDQSKSPEMLSEK
ncbi:polysaccharide ABC transporter ATP-binding protein [Planctomicrobium sp. SH661]|uniref:ABC transporter ATP-binding protein n=1 Tax=Planctomicrobium sp. SH661 TaxID=3448124 RepID=UPI003F5B7C5F